jgi:hypothetical protein
VKIAATLLRDIIHEDYEGPEWTLVEDETTGTWRWGIMKRAILKYETQGQPMSFWGIYYQVQTSNEDYILGFMDDIEVELWNAVPVPVSKIEYQRRKDEPNTQ